MSRIKHKLPIGTCTGKSVRYLEEYITASNHIEFTDVTRTLHSVGFDVKDEKACRYYVAQYFGIPIERLDEIGEYAQLFVNHDAKSAVIATYRPSALYATVERIKADEAVRHLEALG